MNMFQVKMGIGTWSSRGARMVKFGRDDVDRHRRIPGQPGRGDAAIMSALRSASRLRRTAACRRVQPNDASCVSVRRLSDAERPPKNEQPEAEHVQAREGNVGRADLQRHDRVAQSDEQRRREEEQQ